MPIYEYQGQQYEMSTTDPQEAKNKILAHLGQTPKEETSLLKKFTSGVASVGDIVAGAPAFAVGAVGAPLVSTYQGLVEGKSPKEAAQEGRKFAEEVGTSKWATPFKSALEGAGYFDPQAYEQEIARQAMGKVAGGIETVGEKVESATGGAIPKEQVQMVADVGMLAGIPGAGKVGKIVKEKVTTPTSADLAAMTRKREDLGYGKKATEQEARVNTELEQLIAARDAKRVSETASMGEQAEIPFYTSVEDIAARRAEVSPQPDLFAGGEGLVGPARPAPAGGKIGEALGTRQRAGEGVPLEQTMGGKLREELPIKEEAPIVQASPLETAVDKISSGQKFAMSAEERIAFEKAKSAVEVVEPEFATLSDKQILERMMDREWVQNAVNKSRQMDAMYADIAQRTKDAETRNEMIKNRELLADHLEALEEQLLKMPTEKVGQGPKTREARMNEQQGIMLMRSFNPVEAAVESYKLAEPALKKAAEILDKYGEDAARVFLNTYYDQDRLKNTQTQQNVAKAVANINPRLAEAVTPYRDISREEALNAVKNSPDSETSTLGFVANQLKSRGRLGIEKIKNEGVRSGLAHLIGLRDKAGIAANTILQGDNGIMRNLRKLETLLGEGRAGEVIRQIQEGQFNPEYKFNLDAEQMKVKDQIQAMFEQTRQEMERITGKPVKQIPNYFPSMFFGPWAVELRDANGRLVAFVTEKNRKTAEAAARNVIEDMASKGESLKSSPAKFRGELQSEAFRNRGGLAPYFESMMDLLGSDDPLVQQAQQSVQNLVAKRAMDTKKVSQRLMHKAGVVGAMGERGWKSAKENYRDAKDVLENYVRAFEDWKANQDTAQFLNDVKENTGATNTYNILQNYFDDIRADRGALDKFGNDLATSLAKATGHDISGASKTGARKTADFMTKIWLGFYNPVAMGQNVLQPIHTLPKLVELASSGGSKDVISPFLIGMAQSLKDVSSLAGEKLLGKELTETARYMKEQEVIKPGLVESEGGTKIGHNIEKIGVSGGLLATEAFARATSFNIFREYLKASGLDEAKAREVAKNMTHEYMVNYEKYAKPGVLTQGGFLGEMAGRLQSFKFNQFTQLANYIEAAKRSKNPSAALTSLAVSIGMAGVSGMIGMDIAEGLYGMLVSTGAVEPDTKSPRQMALDIGGPAAVGIPTAATGKWLSGSLSSQIVGDLSWRSLLPVVFGAGETVAKLPTLGKMVKEQITGEQLVPESEKAAALMAVTPATMRGVLENKLLTDEAGRIVSPYTGETSYVKGPQDEGILSLTNVRSRERGETIARSVLQKAQEKRITEERSKVTDKLKKFVDESARKGTPLNPETVGKALERIVELQGDPANTINTVLTFVKNNQLGDWFDRQVASGNVTMTNVYRKLRALEQKQMIGK